jgi:hypothetical protein
MDYRAIAAPAVACAMALSLLCLPISAEAGPATMLCRNTTSGATWTVTVDSQAATVDGIPARITSGLISWKDDEGRFYDLHRDTGVLEMHVASSTGGFYLMDQCSALAGKAVSQ